VTVRILCSVIVQLLVPIVTLVVRTGFYSSNPKDVEFMISFQTALCIEVYNLPSPMRGGGKKKEKEGHPTPPPFPISGFAVRYGAH